MGTGLTEPVAKGVAQVFSAAADSLLAPPRHRPEGAVEFRPFMLNVARLWL